MSFVRDFIDHGYLYQCTDLEKLTLLSDSNKIACYVGFDCTAPSLHVGNLLQVMILRLLQKHGHKPIIIVGGGTTKIGDPSGRDSLRKILTNEEIAENISGIKKSLSQFIKFGDGESDAVMLNNSDWLGSINYVEFLREYGRHVSVNRMLSMDSVKLRLDRQQSLTFLEFNYSLLQAYDFCKLNKEYNCVLQIGGSDQWGNILMGVDLCHRINGKEVYGLTTPLLTTSSGQKMGKSVSGAVWLNKNMLSSYDYYQYWRNCDDADIIKFAKLYGEFSNNELHDIEKLVVEDVNTAKKQLAFRLTILCRGEVEAQNALETSIKLFEQGAVDDNLPAIFVDKQQLIDGIIICELFVIAKLVSSKSEGRRLIRGKGAKLNDQIIDDENMVVTQETLIDNEYLKLSVGKKKHILIKLR